VLVVPGGWGTRDQVSNAALVAWVKEKAAGAKYSWDVVQKHVEENGIEPWLERSLRAASSNICEAMNVLGLGRVVITGTLTTLPAARDFMASEIKKGSLWGKFGEVGIEFAPRRRMRGMISVGIERLVVGT